LGHKILEEKIGILENDVGIQQIVWISEGRRQPVQFKSWPKILEFCALDGSLTNFFVHLGGIKLQDLRYTEREGNVAK
jgi:hypothetical protein